VDTGGGTGLGNTAFLYSVDDGALPDPSTYSANATFIEEAATADTTVLLNGTLYTLDTFAAPEPSTFGLLSLGMIAMLLFRTVARRAVCSCPGRDVRKLALSGLELEPIARVDREHLRRGLPERCHVFLRRAFEDLRRSVVHRDDELWLEPLSRGVRRVLRVHDEVAADRHQDEVGLVVVGDQLHVAEASRSA